MRSFILLYQCGIANVLEVVPSGYIRVMQSDFRTCENFFRGMIFASKDTRVQFEIMHANVAGDATLQADKWEYGRGTMFEESKASSHSILKFGASK